MVMGIKASLFKFLLKCKGLGKMLLWKVLPLECWYKSSLCISVINFMLSIVLNYAHLQITFMFKWYNSSRGKKNVLKNFTRMGTDAHLQS